MNDYQKERYVMEACLPVIRVKAEIRAKEEAIEELKGELVVLERNFKNACKFIEELNKEEAEWITLGE